jgi:hypothetical protein
MLRLMFLIYFPARVMLNCVQEHLVLGSQADGFLLGYLGDELEVERLHGVFVVVVDARLVVRWSAGCRDWKVMLGNDRDD